MAALTKCNARDPKDEKHCIYIIDGSLCSREGKCYWGPYEPAPIPCSDDEIDLEKPKKTNKKTEAKKDDEVITFKSISDCTCINGASASACTNKILNSR
jgi:hypothetical protein